MRKGTTSLLLNYTSPSPPSTTIATRTHTLTRLLHYHYHYHFTLTLAHLRLFSPSAAMPVPVNEGRLAELMDASLKFTKVLNRNGVSQATLQVQTASRPGSPSTHENTESDMGLLGGGEGVTRGSPARRALRATASREVGPAGSLAVTPCEALSCRSCVRWWGGVVDGMRAMLRRAAADCCVAFGRWWYAAGRSPGQSAAVGSAR